MAMWLYQLSAEKEFEDGSKWTPEVHREEVWEGQYLEWDTRQIRSLRSGTKPTAGDTVIYWFVKRGIDEPGLYDSGIIFEYNQDEETIKHLPIFPSAYLKMHPIYDDDMIELVKGIQNRMPIATMFEINDDHAQKLWIKIRNWIIHFSEIQSNE